MSAPDADARKAAVLSLFEATPPRGYQRIVLPDGHVIPGWDRSRVADRIYPARLDGRTVLDIGCDYGYFLHEAIRRGASRALGIERDAATHAVAECIASLWNGTIEVRHGRFPEVSGDERFDLVLCLNVLHHVSDPWAVMRSAAARCRGMLVVEFALPSGVQYWCDAARKPESVFTQASRARRWWHRLRYGLYGRAIDRLGRNRPLIGVGSAPEGRTFYFNQAAFRNAFVVQQPICESVEFAPSPGRERQRMLAFCEVTGGRGRSRAASGSVERSRAH
ncbi:MAG TPA: methyltransferase domain-containing protein [Aeromicrobium sp.]|nr:methyltransferase domain-containing protein [Aeromicrobium sp.]